MPVSIVLISILFFTLCHGITFNHLECPKIVRSIEEISCGCRNGENVQLFDDFLGPYPITLNTRYVKLNPTDNITGRFLFNGVGNYHSHYKADGFVAVVLGFLKTPIFLKDQTLDETSSYTINFISAAEAKLLEKVNVPIKAIGTDSDLSLNFRLAPGLKDVKFDVVTWNQLGKGGKRRLASEGKCIQGIPWSPERVSISFDREKNKLGCKANTPYSSVCGKCGLPKTNQFSETVLLKKISINSLPKLTSLPPFDVLRGPIYELENSANYHNNEHDQISKFDLSVTRHQILVRLRPCFVRKEAKIVPYTKLPTNNINTPPFYAVRPPNIVTYPKTGNIAPNTKFPIQINTAPFPPIRKTPKIIPYTMTGNNVLYTKFPIQINTAPFPPIRKTPKIIPYTTTASPHTRYPINTAPFLPITRTPKLVSYTTKGGMVHSLVTVLQLNKSPKIITHPFPPVTTQKPKTTAKLEIVEPGVDKCGIRNDLKNEDFYGLRIIGGQRSPAHAWPWQIMIMGERDFACSGSIIKPNVVLTAAHCFMNLELNYVKKNFKIIAGLQTIDYKDAKEKNKQILRIKHFISHKDFKQKGNAFDNDIALVLLRTSFDFNAFVSPICLPPQAPLSNFKECVVSGWGETRKDETSGKLNHLLLPLISSKKCNETGIMDGSITKSMLCAGYLEGGKDACQGDSGGPLTCLYEKRWHLVGVVSWGINCARPNRPGVYTHVIKYLPWIQKNLKKLERN